MCSTFPLFFLASQGQESQAMFSERMTVSLSIILHAVYFIFLLCNSVEEQAPETQGHIAQDGGQEYQAHFSEDDCKSINFNTCCIVSLFWSSIL